LLAFLTLAWCSAPAVGVDLTKIDRRIAREPAYQSKSPRYCLLVFGPEARTRVWLVLDGEVLYIDRNGNGDLTEEGKQVKVKLRDANAEKGPAFNRAVTDLGPITDREGIPQATRLELDFHWNPVLKQEETSFLMKVDGQSRQFTTGQDLASTQDPFQFGSTPQRAPIIHFNGPLTLQLTNRVLGRTRGILHVTVGTPGQGPGTFAHLYHEAVQEGLAPQVEITYPSKTGGPPLQETMLLKGRC
jgi:hypothetical protein